MTSSPVSYAASMPIIHTMSAMPIRATKHAPNCMQTTITSTGTTAITMTVATAVAMLSSCTVRAIILPCPTTAMLGQTERAKPRKILFK
jgi:hypothetical protein